MKAFVTGASGFLGGRLVQMLVERGVEVTLLARPGSVLSHLEGLPIHVAQGDLSDPLTLQAAVKDASHIFHCAACSTDWAPPAAYFQANVLGVRNLLAAARHASGLERFVHVSTTDIYGYPLTPCSEDSPFVDSGLPYNQTKGLGEQAVWDAHRQHALPITILRPATIFGPRGKDFTLEVATLLRQRLMATIDGGRAPGGFTYVDHVVQAMLSAAHSGAAIGQAYNISDGTGASWNDYLSLFAAKLHVPRPWINLSFPTAMAAARLFETPHRMLKLPGRPLLTRHAVYLLGRNQEFPIAKAQRDLKFKPELSFEEGVERAAAWLREGTWPDHQAKQSRVKK